MVKRLFYSIFLIIILNVFININCSFSANLIFSDGYENGLGNWNPVSAASTQSSEQAHSGIYSLRSNRAAGTPQCIRNFTFPTDTNKLFLRFWLYVTPGGNDFSGKWMRYITQSGGNEAQMEMWGTGQEALLYWYSRQGGSSCYSSPSPGGAGPGSFNKGDWVQFELFVELNDPGSSNGRVRLWLNRPPGLQFASADAYKKYDRSNTTLRGSGSCGIVYGNLHLPTGYNTGSPVIYFDDVELWDGLPGGGGGGDSSAPYTSGHYPAKDSVGFYKDSNIIVHILDSGDGVDQSSIAMTVNGKTVSPNITETSSDYTLTYDPPNPLEEGDVVVTLNARDLANPPNVMSQETYTFTVNKLKFVE